MNRFSISVSLRIAHSSPIKITTENIATNITATRVMEQKAFCEQHPLQSGRTICGNQVLQVVALILYITSWPLVTCERAAADVKLKCGEISQGLSAGGLGLV